MTELRDPNTPETKPSGVPNGSPTDDSAVLHSLYRMSRTAGLGSGDYVAINNTAILALLLGCFSVLSLVYPLLLLVAVAALFCGVLALVQIRSSNGTQTGRVFAAIGILLALGLGGMSGWKQGIAYVQKRSDERAIGKVVKQLSDLIVAKQYSQAYQTLFSENFHKEFSEQKFADQWEALAPHFGPVKQIDWGNQADFDVIKGTDTRRAVIISTVNFEKFPDPARQPIVFILRDQDWVIEDFQQLFPKPKTAEQPDGRTPQGPQFFGGDQPDGGAAPR